MEIRAVDDIVRRGVFGHKIRHQLGITDRIAIFPSAESDAVWLDDALIQKRTQAPFEQYAGGIGRNLDASSNLITSVCKPAMGPRQ